MSTSRGALSPWHEVVQLRDDLKSGELPLAVFAADLYDVVMQKGPPAGVRATRSVLCPHLPHPQSARTGQGCGPSPGRTERQGVPQAGGQLRRRQDAHADRAPAPGTRARRAARPSRGSGVRGAHRVQGAAGACGGAVLRQDRHRDRCGDPRPGRDAAEAQVPVERPGLAACRVGWAAPDSRRRPGRRKRDSAG